MLFAKLRSQASATVSLRSISRSSVSVDQGALLTPNSLAGKVAAERTKRGRMTLKGRTAERLFRLAGPSILRYERNLQNAYRQKAVAWDTYFQRPQTRASRPRGAFSPLWNAERNLLEAFWHSEKRLDRQADSR